MKKTDPSEWSGRISTTVQRELFDWFILAEKMTRRSKSSLVQEALEMLRQNMGEFAETESDAIARTVLKKIKAGAEAQSAGKILPLQNAPAATSRTRASLKKSAG